MPETNLHVARDYHAGPGLVFIETVDVGRCWRLVPAEEALAGTIITCAHCKKPAARLDCFWPYMTSQNACLEHLAIKQQEDRERKAKRAAQARQRRVRQKERGDA